MNGELLYFVGWVGDKSWQKVAALGVFRILFWVSSDLLSQVVAGEVVAYCRRRGGPHFWRHYSCVLSRAARHWRWKVRANRSREATKWGFVLFHLVWHGGD